MSNHTSHQRRSRSGRDTFEDELFGGSPTAFVREVPHQPPASGNRPLSDARGERAPVRSAQTAERMGVKATVKWYSSEKGFGFVTDETGLDLLLHATVLRMFGREDLAPGSRIVIDVGRSDRGEKAVALHSVEDPDPVLQSRSQPAPAARRRTGYAATSVGEITGTVKWFDTVRGFGFVAPDNGGKDMFLHASALERSGIAAVQEGTRIKGDIVTGRSGKTEIGTLRLID